MSSFQFVLVVALACIVSSAFARPGCAHCKPVSCLRPAGISPLGEHDTTTACEICSFPCLGLKICLTTMVNTNDDHHEPCEPDHPTEVRRKRDTGLDKGCKL